MMMMIIITITIKLAVVFSQTLWNLFSHCCCVLWQYFVLGRSVGSALIEVLLFLCFFRRVSVTPPSPPSNFLLSVFPLPLHHVSHFLVIVIAIVDIVLLNAKIPRK